jgi:hypothetical protein
VGTVAVVAVEMVAVEVVAVKWCGVLAFKDASITTEPHVLEDWWFDIGFELSSSHVGLVQFPSFLLSF